MAVSTKLIMRSTLAAAKRPASVANGIIIMAVMVVPFLGAFAVDESGSMGRHYSYATVAILPLGIAALWLFIRGHRPSPTVWACIGVSGALFLSGVINGTLSNGTLLSILQTWVMNILIAYLLTGCCRQYKERVFIRRLAVVGVFGVLIEGWLTLGSSMHVSFKYGEEILGEGVNWNSIGIGFVSLFALLITGVIARESPRICAIGIAPCVIGIMLSFSRAAYIVFAFVVLGAAFSRGIHRLGNIAGTILLFTTIAAGSLWWGFQAFPGAQEFIGNKATEAQGDLVNVRLKEKNIQPIEQWLDGDVGMLLFGDGKSTEHSVLSQSLVMTGLTGFAAMMALYLQVIARSWPLMLHAGNTGIKSAAPLWVLVPLTIGVFAQDCASNTTNMSGFASGLFLIAMAVLEPKVHWSHAGNRRYVLNSNGRSPGSAGVAVEL